MSSYLNLAMSLLLEICCCPQSNTAQMLTQILINKELPSILSVKPVLISHSGPDETLSQAYYLEQNRMSSPAEEDSSSSSSRTHSNEMSFPPLCAQPGVQVQLSSGQSQRPVPALRTSMWNLHLKQLLQGSKSQARKYPFLQHQFHLPTAGNNARCFAQLTLC